MMKRYFVVVVALALGACDALTIAGSNRVSDNVAVSIGTTITDEGVQKPRGNMTIGIF